MIISNKLPRQLFSFECIVCGGGSLFERQVNRFGDGEEDACQECGTIYSISCDAESDAQITTNEHTKDIGQPRCDNTCDLILMSSPALVAEFFGSPCKWNCEKTKAWCVGATEVQRG